LARRPLAPKRRLGARCCCRRGRDQHADRLGINLRYCPRPRSDTAIARGLSADGGGASPPARSRQLSEKFELGFGYTFCANGACRGPGAGGLAGPWRASTRNAAVHVVSLQGTEFRIRKGACRDSEPARRRRDRRAGHSAQAQQRKEGRGEEEHRLQRLRRRAGHGLRRDGRGADDPGSHRAADHEPQVPRSTTLDARNATPPPRFGSRRRRAPQRCSSCSSTTWGRPVQRLRRAHPMRRGRLAQQGLRYNQFHTTALSSPRGPRSSPAGTTTRPTPARSWRPRRRSRAIPDSARRAWPRWRRCCATTATARRTSQETRDPAWEVSPSGRRTAGRPQRVRQVLRLHGRRDQPVGTGVYEGLVKVEVPKDANYHFLTGHDGPVHQVGCGSVKALTPDRPFFIYFAPGATHAPHHVPKEWIATVRGKFDQAGTSAGPDLAAKLRLGVVRRARSWRQARRHQDWTQLTADEKKLFTRQMSLRRLRGVHRRRVAARRRHRGDGPAREHARLLRPR